MNQEPPRPQEPYSSPLGITGQQVLRPVFRPYITYVLIGICVGIFLLQYAIAYLFQIDIANAFAKDNAMIMRGQLWRLITPMFLHASVLHLGFNMYALFAIGTTIERFYGRGRYVALFLIGGFAGNVMSFLFTLNPSLGSSTAIFGLLGAEGVLFYHNREVFGSMAPRALSQVIVIGVINLIIGMTPNSGIDNWGHIGGLIGGTLFAWFAGPQFRRQGMYPPYSIGDNRSQREVIIAGIAVTGLFFFLAIAGMFMRG
ncbi:MAG: rhomboid family intramembrane serine protease [Anaerolineales bacterium]|nr:rhomboid family intramembrane serine protease [Anaerolineae bacterium]PWB56424.1 MAG: rhomboid family intramembrane serine protease [Anaerolineales bacterium]